MTPRRFKSCHTHQFKMKRYCNEPTCRKELTKPSQLKYCSNICKSKYYRDILIKKWLNNKLDGSKKSGAAGYVKSYLLEKYDYKCSLCGWGEINPYSGNIPLEVEHIDGNSYNNKPENVTLLCPNCHSLTKSYRGANRGNGRRSYLKDYYIKDSEGKVI